MSQILEAVLVKAKNNTQTTAKHQRGTQTTQTRARTCKNYN